SGASSVVGLLNDVNKARNLYNNVSGLLNPGVNASQLSANTASLTYPAQPLMTTPADAGVTSVDGPLYSGATNANADLAAQEANAYTANGGLLGSVSAAGAGTGV